MHDHHKVWPGRNAITLLYRCVQNYAAFKRAQVLVALPVKRDFDNYRQPVPSQMGQFVQTEQRYFAFNQPGIFQALDAPHASGWRNMRQFSERLIAQTAVHLHRIQQFNICGVDIYSIHLGTIYERIFHCL